MLVYLIYFIFLCSIFLLYKKERKLSPFFLLFMSFCIILYCLVFKLDLLTIVLVLTSFLFCINDMFERQIHIFPSVILFFFIGFYEKIPPLHFIIYIGSFLLFYLFCHYTKEKLIGIGDFYFIYPIALYFSIIKDDLLPAFMFESDTLFTICNFLCFVLYTLFWSSIFSLIYYLPHFKNAFYALPFTVPVFFTLLALSAGSFWGLGIALILMLICSFYEKKYFPKIKI